MKEPSKGVTRRDVALVFVATSAVGLAQQAPAEDLVASAREQVRSNSETLRKFKVPTATEPSFAFRP
jgi:hypothetical protein